MTPRSPRNLSANGPINPRTAPAVQHTRSASGAAQNLVARQRYRAQLGPGLRRQASPMPTRGGLRLRRALGWVALSGLVSSVALAVLQGTWLWLVVALGASAAWLFLRTRTDASATPRVGLGAAELDAFDRLLAAVAGELSDAQRAMLREIKTLIVEIAGHGGTTDAPLAFDEELYAIACVRRYLPDSLAAFVAVPVALRADPTLASSGSAAELLTRQLELLRAQLKQCRLRAARGTVGPLLRQHRFLEAQGKCGSEDEPA